MYNLVVKHCVHVSLKNNAKITNEILLAAKHEDKRVSMAQKKCLIHFAVKNLFELHVLCIAVTTIGLLRDGLTFTVNG
jgi:hypothetical protein